MPIHFVNSAILPNSYFSISHSVITIDMYSIYKRKLELRKNHPTLLHFTHYEDVKPAMHHLEHQPPSLSINTTPSYI